MRDRAVKLIVLAALPLLAACNQLKPVTTLQDGATGDIVFQSQNPYILRELKQGSNSPLAVKGSLTLPPETGRRVPVIVMMHGSGGRTDAREGDLARLLAQNGVGAFAVDSFDPRGAASTITDQLLVSEEQMMADAFAALQLLRTHPRIDPRRIAVMGFSKGGTVAWLTSSTLVRDFLAPGTEGFAAHIAWYPFCGVSVPGSFGQAPHLMLLGGKDDYTPPEPCRQVAGAIARAAPLTLREYPDAHHAWDGTGPIRYIEKGIGAGKCAFDLLEDGRLKLKNSDLFVEGRMSRGRALRQCYHLGVTVGRHEEAARQARADMLAFVKANLLDTRMAAGVQ